MIEKIFKCVMCEGNVYPCVLSVKSATKILIPPTKCPFEDGDSKWEEVKE